MLQTSRLRPRDRTKVLRDSTPSTKTGPAPHLKVAKIGIVSRDYNKVRDFSETFSDILNLLDKDYSCDTVLFSPWSIDAGKSCRPSVRLRHIKSVLYEEFKSNGKKRKGKQFVVFYRRGGKWHRHCLGGRCFGFASLKGLPKGHVEKFVQDVKQHRILGECCVLICGESNGVPYHMDKKRVLDDFGLRRSLPRGTVVLNPVHDWMSRYEMPLKRKFLSKDRWVISVWNRGKRPRDGKGHPWNIYRDKEEEPVTLIQNHGIEKVEIGIVKISGHGS